jgi:hypothetical protein
MRVEAMRVEAISAGFYETDLRWRDTSRFDKYPRLQILTIEELLSGKEL